MKTRRRVPLRYIPKRLTQKDKKMQAFMIKKSRRLYKQGNYFTRKSLKSFKSKKSSHVSNAKRIYNINVISASDELAKKTGCSKKVLEKIISKGEGAYYSSGSRPNQTPQSWGIARLASALTSGKAAAVDYNILEQGCKKNSPALKMAKKANIKYHYGKHGVPKVNI
jgi:hypothetical protein